MAGVPMNSPLDALAQMRLHQPQPTGVGQQMPTAGASGPGMLSALQGMAGGGPQPPQEPPNPLDQPFMGHGDPGASQGPLAALEQAALGHGDMAQLMRYLPILQKMFPKLKVADMHHGRAELVGPTQEQFLGAAHAKHHGAKGHHVANQGRGQRLHVHF